MTEQIMMTVAQAVQASGLSRSGIYEAMSKGALTGRKHGQKTMIMRDDLEKYLNDLPVYVPGGYRRGGSPK